MTKHFTGVEEKEGEHIRVCTYMHTYVFVCVRAHIYMTMCMCAYAHKHVHVGVCVQICVHVYVWLYCVYKYISRGKTVSEDYNPATCLLWVFECSRTHQQDHTQAGVAGPCL